MSNILSLIGRPNVGKSTFFNRLIKAREAIVDSVAGVTRDRHYGKSDWNGYEFSVIDTGGYVVGSDDIFEAEIRKQATLAIEESDVIILMVDGREGLTPLDEEVADILRQSGKPYYLAVNKIDSPSNYLDYTEFYALGIPDIYPISAASGGGTGDLLDAVVQHFSKDKEENTDDLPHIAISIYAFLKNIGNLFEVGAQSLKHSCLVFIRGTTALYHSVSSRSASDRCRL